MKVVLIEDDATLNRVLKRAIEKYYSITAFTSPAAAVEYLADSSADAVVSDIRMPGMTGFDVLEKIKTATPETYVLLMTGQSTIDESVTAIKKGAYDYIPKPVDTELLIYKLQMIEENISLKNTADLQGRPGSFVMESQSIKDIASQAQRVAKSDTNVMLTGETGTGKEVMARYIHENSNRRKKIFAAINCCNLQPHLFERELFGHKKGAFTGADKDSKGIVQTAYGGTLFLDEIGEMPIDLQPKFLRFLETKSFYPVGASTQETSDIRIIAATNRNPLEMVAKGLFREDLYYRLNVFNIELPPLRERKDDIIPLAEHFIEKFRHINTKVMGLEESALACLRSYAFPGNIRELSNIIERAMILEQTNRLTCASLNLGCSVPDEDMTLDTITRKHILSVLDAHEGNKQKAAATLGVDTSTIYRKLKEYGIG
ncbi:two component, sigma54 specific, transcriptional regulator, Fis family [Denitrovibrio acetiphilus DSM 12809]|uniref:Two component, sigma54 specific, transcriptional regulator, Fis family n=1 Tax=Denitrovibrio acetiphilus (strain DSM 12809 / NBRC 114555 / N2460) TaxID=522772 RepID=D4H3E4_DENA2|nr:sigma-54 dependent transcriptional regulator [Denitrovibrio acetiphilus]ADD67228.1 two component, sigma54 specific, transcriptional regulator, Fis family [Denitrovibrio acetiphilus DSM 12809]